MQIPACQPGEQVMQELRSIEGFVSVIDIWVRINHVSPSSDTQYSAVVQIACDGKTQLQMRRYIPNFHRGAGKWIVSCDGETEACKRIHMLLSQLGGAEV